jgi:fluoride exporter
VDRRSQQQQQSHAAPSAAIGTAGVDAATSAPAPIRLTGMASRVDVPVLTAVSAGGVLGALTRYGLAAAWPHEPGAFPWSTWLVNVSGCLLIGVLMTVLTRRAPTQRLIHPFAGVGILGGYTTFSTAAVDVLTTRPVPALLYLAATVIGALLAVWAGASLTAALVPTR